MSRNPVSILTTAATLGCAAVFFAAVPTSASAGELNAKGDPCANRLEVDARDVPLKAVLDRASKILGMTYKVDDAALVEAPVTAKRSGSPQDVLKALLADRNVVIETQPLERCGGAEGVVRVWILRAGEDGARVAAPAAAATQPGDGTIYPFPAAPPGRHGRPNRGAGKAQGPSHQRKREGGTVPEDGQAEAAAPAE